MTDSTVRMLLARAHRVASIGPGTIVFDHFVTTKEDKIHIGSHCRIDDFVKLEGGLGLTIGDFVHVCSFVHLNIGGGTLVIGDRAGFASGAKIVTGGNQIEGQSMSASAPSDLQVLKRDTVEIGEDAFVGTNAVVLPGCHMGRGSRLAAGSVLTEPIPAYEVWAGVPARKIKEIYR